MGTEEGIEGPGSPPPRLVHYFGAGPGGTGGSGIPAERLGSTTSQCQPTPTIQMKMAYLSLRPIGGSGGYTPGGRLMGCVGSPGITIGLLTSPGGGITIGGEGVPDGGQTPGNGRGMVGPAAVGRRAASGQLMTRPVASQFLDVCEWHVLFFLSACWLFVFQASYKHLNARELQRDLILTLPGNGSKQNF